MRIGDTIEAAVWLTGAETDAMKALYISEVTEAITELCDHEGYLHGPVRSVEKHPLDDRVPAVPENIQGPDVRLFVVEADVIAPKPETKKRAFVGDLEAKDLERLRTITADAYMTAYGYRPSTPELDDIIEDLGPESAVKTLRQIN